ncbi:PREDICTED: proteasome activator complex subunit 3-like isoform X2 [Priapulus caudatus]|nr:PREDICTED: proteasome activator complex subunit 3-like isoform X2 [Priapulus caudatus]
MAEFKEKIKKEAEQLVNDVFLKKVQELDDLLLSPLFANKDLNLLHMDINIPVPPPAGGAANCDGMPVKKRKLDVVENEIGSPVFVLPLGSAPSNKHIVEIIDTMKPNIQQLIDHTNKVKMWIQFLIPRIEDGNNFGVSIQEETLAEVRTVEGEAASFLDQISRYFITRAKIISKVAKYPHVDDYRRAIDELDEKQFISLQLVCCELRNNYSVLHDLITKNIDKIKRPRTAHNHSLY